MLNTGAAYLLRHGTCSLRGSSHVACCAGGRQLRSPSRCPPAKATGSQQRLSAPLVPTCQARDSGASSHTDTSVWLLPDASLNGIEFVVRLATTLNKKPSGVSAKPGGGKTKAPVNPFLPYEEALWVAHLSDTHTCVLNKFNVVEHHVIVVTREFESQGDPLYMNDLAAAAAVLAAMPHGGMAFYNCGEHSGRSQPHKHMQVVPLPLHDAAVGVDVECPPLLALASAAVKATGSPAGVVVPVKELPYACYAAHVHDVPPETLASTCDALLAAAFGEERGAEISYNVVLTKQLIMLVPRSAEKVGPLAINSLGFAGTILVRSEEDKAFVKEHGPAKILTSVGRRW